MGLLLIAFSSGLRAQKSSEPQYYHSFVVEFKSLDQSTEQALGGLFNQREYLKIESSCREGNKILIAVNADYPKRVEAIKSEINEMLTDKLGKRKVVSVANIPSTEKNTYCP